MNQIRNGNYPTMLVAYDDNNRIDYHAMEQLIEWYIEKGVDGIFALCHSTEIHCLSFEERYELGKFVLKQVNGRVSVVMGGVTPFTHKEQLLEAQKLAELRPDALVLLTNRVDYEEGADFKRNIEDFLRVLPEELPLGAYETPLPYKRVLADDEIAYLAGVGRFAFIKDTCCDTEMMARRAAIVKGTPFKLFNANIASLLDTLRMGYAGFSGIMANFHPDLFAYLYRNRDNEKADALIPYLGVMSLIEARSYPIIAKQYLAKYEGIDIKPYCRSNENKNPQTALVEMDQIHTLTELWRRRIEEEK